MFAPRRNADWSVALASGLAPTLWATQGRTLRVTLRHTRLTTRLEHRTGVLALPWVLPTSGDWECCIDRFLRPVTFSIHSAASRRSRRPHRLVMIVQLRLTLPHRHGTTPPRRNTVPRDDVTGPVPFLRSNIHPVAFRLVP
ncbi:hypothetical protein C8Q80DRAFT_393108 [Daedaleopsis nitida]|nr:hypothetical protein C8Q80DRAFT_393108 [Daedaleopsis nitida]